MFRTDGDGNVSNMFSNGVAGVSEATQVNADWLNAMQEEVAHTVEGAGITLDKTNSSQLLAAVKVLANNRPHGSGSAVGTQSITATSYTDIPNTSVTLTNTGKPVVVTLTGGEMTNSSGSLVSVNVQALRGSTVLAVWTFQIPNNAGIPMSLMVVDAGASVGSNTFKFQALVPSGTATLAGSTTLATYTEL